MALHLNGINSLRIVLGASMARAAFGLGGGALGYSRYGLSSFGLGILLGEIVATGMTARYFLRHEVSAKGLRIRGSDLGPVSLSTGSALLFFVGAGFGWWSVGWLWSFAACAIAAASIWGWMSLDAELRNRLKSMAFNMFPR
jgi:hypothetical protein